MGITFDPNDYANLPVPGDTTLDVCKRYIVAQFYANEGGFTHEAARKIIREGRCINFDTVGITVAYFYSRQPGAPDRECPGSMTLDEFRALVPAGIVSISLGDGGVKSRPLIPELT